MVLAITVNINPILIDLGPIRVSWYGLMYVLGFIAAYLLVRYQMLIFEDLTKVDDRSLMKIIKEVDNKTLILALKGASNELKEKLFKNMSERDAQVLQENLERMTEVRLKDIETAQQSVLKIGKRLESEGKIPSGALKKKYFGVSKLEVENLFFYLILGLIIGARLGYVLFYDLKIYLADPLEIFAVWHGGMSFHGGLIGVLIVGILFCWKNKKSFWAIADLFIVTAPIGLGLGRIGNFINGELYGRVTQVPWAMIFQTDKDLLPRHPSQLYESGLEGGVLFLILWFLKDRKLPEGGLLAVFLSFYGLFRFIVEFFRQPDPQVGFVLGPFTMGQILCSFMILGGIVLFLYLKGREKEKR